MLDAVAAIEHRDWAELRRVLHPYVRWSTPEAKFRGRTKVLAHLAAYPPVPPPTTYELCDGQIYRWTVAPE
ncbi:hypothetical protein [Actinophytocola sp.]|uniref:hypothetical protein n=1 Tax=Actinophytocola sp. TaxID=1872138 RepID=UPI0025BF3180|nr:hypothetical protein [Actinophytocola sp.]